MKSKTITWVTLALIIGCQSDKKSGDSEINKTGKKYEYAYEYVVNKVKACDSSKVKGISIKTRVRPIPIFNKNVVKIKGLMSVRVESCDSAWPKIHSMILDVTEFDTAGIGNWKKGECRDVLAKIGGIHKYSIDTCGCSFEPIRFLN